MSWRNDRLSLLSNYYYSLTGVSAELSNMSVDTIVDQVLQNIGIQVDEDEVLVLSFMNEYDDSGTNLLLETDKMFYSYFGQLSTTASPADQFAVCTWFKLLMHRITDCILSIQPMQVHADTDDWSEFQFFTVGSEYAMKY